MNFKTSTLHAQRQLRGRELEQAKAYDFLHATVSELGPLPENALCRVGYLQRRMLHLLAQRHPAALQHSSRQLRQLPSWRPVLRSLEQRGLVDPVRTRGWRLSKKGQLAAAAAWCELSQEQVALARNRLQAAQSAHQQWQEMVRERRAQSR